MVSEMSYLGLLDSEEVSDLFSEVLRPGHDREADLVCPFGLKVDEVFDVVVEIVEVTEALPEVVVLSSTPEVLLKQRDR